MGGGGKGLLDLDSLLVGYGIEFTNMGNYISPTCHVCSASIASAGPKAAPTEAPLAEACAWLTKLDLMDPALPASAQLRHHLALSGGKFGADVTPAQRSSFLATLLPVESHIAAYQDDIGCLTNPAYHYKLDISHLTPIQQAPIKLQPA